MRDFKKIQVWERVHRFVLENLKNHFNVSKGHVVWNNFANAQGGSIYCIQHCQKEWLGYPS